LIHILDEYTDRGGKQTSSFHNLPESKQDTAANKIVKDIERVEDMLYQGINLNGVKIKLLIMLGGR